MSRPPAIQSGGERLSFRLTDAVQTDAANEASGRKVAEAPLEVFMPDPLLCH